MSETMIQYQVNKQGAPFVQASAPYPKPGPNDLLIRNKAVGLNGLDNKARMYGVEVHSWPAVLGLELAGVVEAVGEAVDGFKPGDEVFSLSDFGTEAYPDGSYREAVVVPAHFAAKRPASLSFEEAASLPVGFVAAASCIRNGLQVALPFLPMPEDKSASYKTVLILGGSSASGAAAIQLLRLSLPSVKILTTSSAKHHSRLMELGADQCFERSAQENTAEIAAATPDGAGVDAIIDAVGAGVAQPSAFTALSPGGPKIFSQLFTGVQYDVPEGVNRTICFGPQIFELDEGKKAMAAFSDLVQGGRCQVPIKVDVLGKGFEAIPAGLERIENGLVSGTKLIVSL